MLGYYHIGRMTETLEEERSAGKEIDLLNPLVFRSFKSFSNFREKKVGVKRNKPGMLCPIFLKIYAQRISCTERNPF